jgi:hypothetical protein
MVTSPPTQPQLPRGNPIRYPSRATGLDITAFVLAFFLPLIGVVLGHVGIHEAHKQGRRASGLAIASLVIDYIGIDLDRRDHRDRAIRHPEQQPAVP